MIAAWRVGRALLWTLAAAILVPLILVVGAVAYLYWSTFAERNSYAAEVFRDVVPYDRVLAQRRFHSSGLFGLRIPPCTFAVVELPDSAASVPPAGPGIRGFYGFSGDWQPTPLSRSGIADSDDLMLCYRSVGGVVMDRLMAAVDEPGSWYILTGSGNTYIYSAPLRIAGRIRVGD